MRLRLTLSFVFLVLVSILSVVLITRQSSANELRAFMFRGGVAGLEELVSSLEDYYHHNGTWTGVGDILEATLSGGGRGQGERGSSFGSASQFRLQLADQDGFIVADTQNAISSGRFDQDQLDAAIELVVDDNIVGYLLPQGGQGLNRSDEQYLVNRLNQAAITAGLVAGGIGLLLAAVLPYQLMKPVRDLTGAAEQFGKGDLSQRVEVKGRDELATLGVTFNQMALSIERAQETRKSMTADIAHELRTPLAVQRAHLEALIDGIYPLYIENLTPILDQNVKLTALVDDLRTLALADSGQLRLEFSSTDITNLVEGVIDRFQPEVLKRQINLTLKKPERPILHVRVDSARLEQVMNNLLTNAIRHAPEGGEIQVIMSVQGNNLWIDVSDNGPGISPDVIPHLFERFYRGDKSRSRSDGGTGLGLAIARQLIEAHGGQLDAFNNPSGGAVFRISLPSDPTVNKNHP